ncbi:MAG: FecCD family ABC transporter permease [Thermodesulfobacteriota bacterium]
MPRSSACSTTVCYKAFIARKVLCITMIGLLLVISILVALHTGAAELSTAEILPGLAGKTDYAGNIIWHLRLPRIATAFLVGWGLALSGTLSQAILKNPLASPYTLGLAAGAGFGAVLAIVSGQGRSGWCVPVFALFLSLGTSLIILGISRLKNATAETLILAGVAVMFLFSALTSFIQYISTMEEVHEIVFWFFGSLSKTGWQETGIMTLMIIPVFFPVMCWSWDLNIMMSGDEAARSLGINVTRTRNKGLLVVSLMTAGAICFTGTIGFIGLVAPHITRMIIGSDHRFLLPASGILGAILVINADILSRTIWAPQVIPVGIVTSFLGVPFFIYLLMRRSREYW